MLGSPGLQWRERERRHARNSAGNYPPPSAPELCTSAWPVPSAKAPDRAEQTGRKTEFRPPRAAHGRTADARPPISGANDAARTYRLWLDRRHHRTPQSALGRGPSDCGNRPSPWSQQERRRRKVAPAAASCASVPDPPGRRKARPAATPAMRANASRPPGAPKSHTDEGPSGPGPAETASVLRAASERRCSSRRAIRQTTVLLADRRTWHSRLPVL